MVFHHSFALTAAPADLSDKQFHSISLSKKKNKVTITWSIYPQQQNVYYEIERAGDDKLFKTAGILFPEEKADGTKNFIFTDNLKNTPGSGVIYYRVKQVHANGQVIYSLTKALTLKNKPVTNVSKTILIYPAIHDNSYCGEKSKTIPGHINYVAGILSKGFVYAGHNFIKHFI